LSITHGLNVEGAPGAYLPQTAGKLGVAIVAYSPLRRSMMTGKYTSIDDFDKDDFRRLIPRYQGDNFAKNITLVNDFQRIAVEKGITPGQLALNEEHQVLGGEHGCPECRLVSGGSREAKRPGGCSGY
jgi:hypothetical protein